MNFHETENENGLNQQACKQRKTDGSQSKKCLKVSVDKSTKKMNARENHSKHNVQENAYTSELE